LLTGAEDRIVDAIDWTESGFGIGNCRLSPLTSGEGTTGDGDGGAKHPSSLACNCGIVFDRLSVIAFLLSFSGVVSGLASTLRRASLSADFKDSPGPFLRRESSRLVVEDNA